MTVTMKLPLDGLTCYSGTTSTHLGGPNSMPMPAASPDKLPTDSQLSFVQSLCQDILLHGDDRDRVKVNETQSFVEVGLLASSISRQDVSRLIDTLIRVKDARRRSVTTPLVPVAASLDAGKIDVGAYRSPSTGALYQVKKSQTSGKLYAREIILPPAHLTDAKCTFKYQPGIIYKIKPDWRLTVDDAEKFGAMYGQCVVCGRTLSRKKSVTEGIGPVCAWRLSVSGKIPDIKAK